MLENGEGCWLCWPHACMLLLHMRTGPGCDAWSCMLVWRVQGGGGYAAAAVVAAPAVWAEAVLLPDRPLVPAFALLRHASFPPPAFSATPADVAAPLRACNDPPSLTLLLLQDMALHVATHPHDPDIFTTGCYSGRVSEGAGRWGEGKDFTCCSTVA